MNSLVDPDSCFFDEQLLCCSSQPGSFTGESRETFPLVFASVLIVFDVLFTLYVIHSVRAAKPTKRHHPARQRNSWLPAIVENDDDDAGEDFVDDYQNSTGRMWPVAKKRKHNTEALLAWSHLSCQYNNNNKRNSAVGTTVLSGSHGVVRKSELVAIMGPSGAGKTTLLDLLSGRKTLGAVEGEISLLGHHYQDGDILTKAGTVLKNVSAYVPQDVVFFPTQTPFEAVAFAANLKLGKDSRPDARESRIQSILELVGLSEETMHRPIGGELAAGAVIRGISGGERKRLALVCSLAMKPSLLFLDEITRCVLLHNSVLFKSNLSSGLDSENAIMVAQTLRALCRTTETAAIVVIHQPSYEVFQCFDRLILLAKGKTVFSNRVSELPHFYETVLCAPFPFEYKVPMDLLRQATQFDKTSIVDPQDAALPPTSKLEERRSEDESVSTIWMFTTLLQRNLTNHYVRNFTNLAQRLATYALTTIFLGLVFWELGKAENGQPISEVAATYAKGAYFMVLVCVYLLPFAQISVVFYDKHVFVSENAIGLYSPWSFALVQFILETWMAISASILVTSFAVPLIGLWNPSMTHVESFLTNLAILCASALTGNAIILSASVFARSQDLAFFLGSGLLAVSLALGGGYVPFSQLKPFISWLQWISPIKFSFQGCMVFLVHGTDVTLLEREELDTPSTVTANLLVLCAFFSALTLLTMVVIGSQREVR